MNAIRVSDKFQIGKAGEYLVCADLLLKGLNVSPAGETLPYDLLLDTGHKILKVQVKTTEVHKRSNQWKGMNDAYIFNIKRKGSNGSKKYEDNEVDIFALVTLDTKQVGYIKNKEMPTTINIRPDKFRGMYHDEKGIALHKEVQSMKSKGIKVKDIANKLGISLTSVRNYYNDNYKPFKSIVPYMAELERSKLWFLE